MITNTFTVRLIDLQPVSTNDVHHDFVVKGTYIISSGRSGGAYFPVLKITFPDETIDSLKTLLNSESVTLSASVSENNKDVLIEITGA